MPRQKIILIIGVLLAVSAVFLVRSYLDEQRKAIIYDAKRQLAKAQEDSIPVLVANTDIPAGSPVDPNKFQTKYASKKNIEPQAISSPDRIAGMVTVVPIAQGEQATLSKFARIRQQTIGLAESTPIGKRAVTISVDNLSSFAGMLKSGNYVDVIATITVPASQQIKVAKTSVIPVFQNVLVLAVGQNIMAGSPEEKKYMKNEKSEASPFITLALSPEEASLFSFIQEQGKIRLVLRSSSDANIERIQPANWENLFNYLNPSLPRSERVETEQVKAEAKAAEGPAVFVEVYRGLNKERVPLSK
jgi:pilus assembly protein CpaB